MNKNAMIAILGLGGMAALFFIFKSKQATQNIGPKQNLGGRPANTVGTTRQDNANQPWYNSAPVQSIVTQVKKNPTQALKDVGSVVHSLSSIWGDISGYFGGSDDSTGAISVDDMPGILSSTSNGSDSEIFSEDMSFDLPDWGGSQTDWFTNEFENSDDFSYSDNFDLDWDSFGLDSGDLDFSSTEDWSVA